MSEGVTVNVTGAADVIRRINSYSLQLSDRVVLLSLRTGANYLKKRIQSAAPVGKTGRLKRSISVRLSKKHRRNRDGAIGVYIKPNKGKKRDDPRGAYYAKFVEDGYRKKTINNVRVSSLVSGRRPRVNSNLVPGQKFIKDTFNSNKETTLSIITRSIETGGNALADRLEL